MGYICAICNPCEPESFHGSYSSGVSSDKFSILKLSLKEKRMERNALKKWESTLSIYVHAHGNDVILIMEASHKNNYPLVNKPSGILDPILCNYGSDHVVLVWYVLEKSFEVPHPFLDKAGVFAIRRQWPVQLLFWSTFEYYPLVSRRIIMPLHCFLWVSWWSNASHHRCHSTGSELMVTREHSISEWNSCTTEFNTPSKFCCSEL